MVRDGFRLLTELGAVDTNAKLTHLGRAMAKLPVDPKLSRILLDAASRDCLNEALVIVSALSVQDPRERPQEKTRAKPINSTRGSITPNLTSSRG